MSDSRNFERLPDQAALDELHRAFGDDGDRHGHGDDGVAADDPPATAAEPALDDLGDLDGGDDGTPDWVDEDCTPTDAADAADDGDGDGDDLVIVEQVPHEPPPESEPEPARPTIVIDDFGSHEADGDGDGSDGGAATGEPSLIDDPLVVALDETVADPVADGAVESGDAPDAAGGPTVISIDDAELPDAVYIQGSLDAGGTHSIVIIEDDEFDDAVDTEAGADARRGIEPRMRERRVAVKRAQGRRRLKWVLVALGAVILVVGTLAVLGSSLFAVRADQITVTGSVYSEGEALDEVIDRLAGTSTFLTDTQALEAELERIPWVDQARIRLDFPRAATIEIREREAWTTYQGLDLQFRVLDDEGRVLDVIDGYAFAYVLIDGPDPVDLQPGDFAPRGYAVASELAKNLTGSIRGRVQLIEVTADGSELSLLLDDGDVRVRFGEARDLFAKLVRLETVLENFDELPRGTIDVSTREVTLPEGATADAAEGADE